MNAHVMDHVQNSFEWGLPFVGKIFLSQYLSRHALMLLLSAGVLVVVFCFIYRRRQRVPAGLTNFLEVFVIFIRDQIAGECLGPREGRRMTPFFCTLFFFILVMNIMGLIPQFSSASSNINVTGALAFIIFLLMTVGAIGKNGVSRFLRSFAPSGVPGPILLLIVPLEVVAFLAKVVTLAMRLFMNMLAGHLIILSMLGIVVVIGIKAGPIFLVVIFMYALELLVAFLQAYIFTLLSAVFIGQAYQSEH